MKAYLRSMAVLWLAASMITPALAQSLGADVYKAKCLMCHGADGQATTPAGKALKAASYRDPAAMKATDDELMAIVRNGKNKMPSYAGKLSESEIKAVVEHVRTLQK